MDSMKLGPDVIARTALGLLDEVGLDGLTMRAVAKALGVQAPALYWHVKNKQELLDAMAAIVFVEAAEGLEAPRRGVTWEVWLADMAHRLRRAMLRHRDGARMFAGTNAPPPLAFRITELTLRTLQDAGFTVRDAARGFPTLLHYTIGCTIEEQARTGIDYVGENPYDPARITAGVDPDRYPLTAQAIADLFDPDVDASFAHGLQIVLTGLRITCLRE